MNLSLSTETKNLAYCDLDCTFVILQPKTNLRGLHTTHRNTSLLNYKRYFGIDMRRIANALSLFVSELLIPITLPKRVALFASCYIHTRMTHHITNKIVVDE